MPQLEPIYEDLLWVSARVDDLSIVEAQIRIQDSSVPDTTEVKKGQGFDELVRYRVSIAPTEYLLGQTELTEFLELWKDSQSEKIVTS